MTEGMGPDALTVANEKEALIGTKGHYNLS